MMRYLHQESTSEDVNFYYAMTMWGIATNNEYLEGLGKLQTRVVSRSINEYFLMKDSNTNHPADFVKNKVSAIRLAPVWGSGWAFMVAHVHRGHFRCQAARLPSVFDTAKN